MDGCVVTEIVSRLQAKLEEKARHLHAVVRSDSRMSLPRSDAVSSRNPGRSRFKSAEALGEMLETGRKLRRKVRKKRHEKKLRSSVKRWQAKVYQLQSKIKVAIQGMQDSIEDFEARVQSRSRPIVDMDTMEPSDENVAAICSYAHRICYSSYAPQEYKVGDPLRLSKPPAPQEHQMAISQLYPFAEKHQSQNPVPMDASNVAKSESLQLPSGLDSVPADWNPGDPVPGEEPSSHTQQTQEEIKQEPRPKTPSVHQAPVEEEEVDFILNPDLDVVEDDYSSEEYSEDDW